MLELIFQRCRQAYGQLLLDYFLIPDEALLAQAGELGRQMVEAGVPPEELGVLQQHALTTLAAAYPEAPLRDVAPPTSALMMEVLMAYGLAFRELGARRREVERLRGQRLETIGTLAGGMAHEFNNLLGVMLGFTELAMLDVDEDGDIADSLVQVKSAALRARDMVQRILSFSRQEEGQLLPLYPARVIEEALELLRRVTPPTVAIEKDIRVPQGRAQADVGQLHQVLLNLGTNAAQALKGQGRITIALSAVRLERAMTGHGLSIKAGDYLCLTMRDDGPGIDPAHLERLFDPFFTTKAVGEGTGLGLSVVHGIVARHRGLIRVDSTPGRGAAFEIFLPRLEDLPEFTS